MEQYSMNFSEMKVDGFLILDLEETDLKTELKIAKKLHRKKILKSIGILKEYQRFLCSLDENKISNEMIEKEKKENIED